jgi:hypothetical protein
MALTAASTLVDAKAQLNANLAWDGDITKASAALEAIRWILANRPQIIATNNRSINFESLQNMETELRGFVSMHGDSVNRASFTRGRMLTI